MFIEKRGFPKKTLFCMNYNDFLFKEIVHGKEIILIITRYSIFTIKFVTIVYINVTHKF